MQELTFWENIWEMLKEWLMDIIPGLLPTFGFKYILIASLIAFVGYALFALIPAAIVFFSGKIISKNTSGFGLTYLGTLVGGLLFSSLFYITDYLIDYEIDILRFFGWFLMVGALGMVSGGIFGLSFKRIRKDE